MVAKQRNDWNETWMPDVPMDMLTSLSLNRDHWIAIARKAPWQATRMNLNTFARHGVFEHEETTNLIAAKLRDPGLIAKARVFPYQLMVAFMKTGTEVPLIVKNALQDAMEIAISNLPAISGGVWVLPDISGSMQSPVTGVRQGSTTAVRCVDVAALVAAAMLRRSVPAGVVPFESKAIEVELNPRDSVMTNARILASLPAGGTNCSAALEHLNRRKAKGDLVIYVSDNESWIDSARHGMFGGGATQTMREWSRYKERNPGARMVCLDIQPNSTTQATDREDILNIGGFSDSVFGVIGEFAMGRLTPAHWTGMIDAVTL
jgi:60 kDa SS-A/Ro ribonucleoprotein